MRSIRMKIEIGAPLRINPQLCHEALLKQLAVLMSMKIEISSETSYELLRNIHSVKIDYIFKPYTTNKTRNKYQKKCKK